METNQGDTDKKAAVWKQIKGILTRRESHADMFALFSGNTATLVYDIHQCPCQKLRRLIMRDIANFTHIK